MCRLLMNSWLRFAGKNRDEHLCWTCKNGVIGRKGEEKSAHNSQNDIDALYQLYDTIDNYSMGNLVRNGQGQNHISSSATLVSCRPINV